MDHRKECQLLTIPTYGLCTCDLDKRMSEWKDIETAPKDGTTIRVKNSVMQHPVLAKWGKYKSREKLLAHIPERDAWVLVKDEHEKYMPLPPGTLVIPDQWQPV